MARQKVTTILFIFIWESTYNHPFYSIQKDRRYI